MTSFVSVFLIKPFLLVLIDTMRIFGGVHEIFVEIFFFESDSPVSSPPGSRSEGLERSKLFNRRSLANE